eukprot:2790078-Prymnesium_polylepis.1
MATMSFSGRPPPAPTGAPLRGAPPEAPAAAGGAGGSGAVVGRSSDVWNVGRCRAHRGGWARCVWRARMTVGQAA